MNSKGIKKHLTHKINEWLTTITDLELVNKLRKNVIITGGALVSLLTNEEPNDYDVYIKDFNVLKELAEYYAKKWHEMHPFGDEVRIEVNGDRVQCFIQSKGMVHEDDENGIDDEAEPYTSENTQDPISPDPTIERPKYRPRYFSTNAITLSDKIQIVIRFWGPAEEIHKNYDFLHCTCSFDYETGKVNLPTDALECILNKELVYVGSRYPLCSIIRTRKYIKRGYSINAGQYLKMCLQLNELDLKDPKVFKDQLTGVDSAYFNEAIKYITNKKEKDPSFEITTPYLIEIINKIF